MDSQDAIKIFKKICPFQSKYFAYHYVAYVSISVFDINAAGISLSTHFFLPINTDVIFFFIWHISWNRQ